MYFNLSYVFTSDDCLGFDSFSRQLSFLYGVRDAHAILLRISSQLNMLIVVFFLYVRTRRDVSLTTVCAGCRSLWALRPAVSTLSVTITLPGNFSRFVFTTSLRLRFEFFYFLSRYSDVALTALDHFVDVVETFVNVAIRLLSCFRSSACPLKGSSSSYALPE